MGSLSRRSFLKQSSLAVAGAGLVSSLPILPAVLGPAETAAPAAATAAETELPEGAALAEPVVAHVKDLATGEINLFQGTRQVVYHDPHLAARLFNAAR